VLNTPVNVRTAAMLGSIVLAACGTTLPLGPFTPGDAGPALTLAPGAVTAIQAAVDRFSGGAAIVIADGRSGRMLHAVAPDERVLAGSLYKLGVLVEAERRIEAGTLRPGDRIEILPEDQAEGGSFTAAGTILTIDEALEAAIVVSDNPPALALVRLLGPASIESTLEREGIAGLRFGPDGAQTTARAVATLLGKLARGSLVSPDASRRMLSRLAREQITDRIPAALPDGEVVAHKTGSLGFATHDAAIVRGPGAAPVVLVVLTWDSGEDEAIALIKTVAATVHAGLARAAGG
jgi:beta-lactamase class A